MTLPLLQHPADHIPVPFPVFPDGHQGLFGICRNEYFLGKRFGVLCHGHILLIGLNVPFVHFRQLTCASRHDSVTQSIGTNILAAGMMEAGAGPGELKKR
jgi:hypothetical protein